MASGRSLTIIMLHLDFLATLYMFHNQTGLRKKGKDKIRQTQIEFLKRALNSGFITADFEIYEWVEIL